MRIPYFKARIKESQQLGVWVGGNLFYDLDPTSIESIIRKAWIRQPLGLLSETFEVEIDTIGQFIGRKDMQGVEIYQNDRVEFYHRISKYNTDTHEYEFQTSEDSTIGVIAIDKSQNWCIKTDSLEYHIDRCKYCKVIGNIHD